MYHNKVITKILSTRVSVIVVLYVIALSRFLNLVAFSPLFLPTRLGWGDCYYQSAKIYVNAPLLGVFLCPDGRHQSPNPLLVTWCFSLKCHAPRQCTAETLRITEDYSYLWSTDPSLNNQNNLDPTLQSHRANKAESYHP